MEHRPFLITLTAPTCAGKSYLFNHIRDVAKLPCLISTTTRSPRKGEVDGVDYFFISDEESRQHEVADNFIELIEYNGYRYGITKTEFDQKMKHGLAFLIAEPQGIEHFSKVLGGRGIRMLKYFVDADTSVRLQRFKQRSLQDIKVAIESNTGWTPVVDSVINRLIALATEETSWQDKLKWDRVLSGENEPSNNLDIILNDIENDKKRQDAVEAFAMKVAGNSI